MRILCAISRRGGTELVRRVLSIVQGQPELILVRVIDTSPREDMDHLPGSLQHGAHIGPRREGALHEAEAEAGKAALDEAFKQAQASGAQATMRLEWGKPEEVIVRLAREQDVTLIAIRAREGTAGQPSLTPPRVGKTARFVLDHAPCDMLLLWNILHPAASSSG